MEQKIRRDRNMGDNLRRLRDENGISQEKLCAELQRRGCDIGRSTYVPSTNPAVGCCKKYTQNALRSVHSTPRRVSPATKHNKTPQNLLSAVD